MLSTLSGSSATPEKTTPHRQHAFYHSPPPLLFHLSTVLSIHPPHLFTTLFIHLCRRSHSSFPALHPFRRAYSLSHSVYPFRRSHPFYLLAFPVVLPSLRRTGLSPLSFVLLCRCQPLALSPRPDSHHSLPLSTCTAALFIVAACIHCRAHSVYHPATHRRTDH